MILDIALGIIIAFVVLSMGRGAVGLALIAAAFFSGFGWVVVLGGGLLGIVAAIGWVADHVRERRYAERQRQNLDLLATLRPRPRELEWYERKEPTIKSNRPQQR